jgi:hypothetical protein
MLYFSQLHVDIWANDERHHFFPDLTFRDLKTFCISLFEILRKIRLEVSLDTTIALGIQLAEINRYHLPSQDFLSLLQKLPKKLLNLVQVLSKFYQSLPPLSYEPEKDLKVFENSVKQSAKILKFPISPSLMKEEGRIVWKIEELEK